jgi:hypothetical protein
VGTPQCHPSATPGTEHCHPGDRVGRGGCHSSCHLASARCHPWTARGCGSRLGLVALGSEPRLVILRERLAAERARGASFSAAWEKARAEVLGGLSPFDNASWASVLSRRAWPGAAPTTAGASPGPGGRSPSWRSSPPTARPSRCATSIRTPVKRPTALRWTKAGENLGPTCRRARSTRCCAATRSATSLGSWTSSPSW